jgi:hypothetical protein
MTAVNPHQGDFAIPRSSGGYVVGRLSARAMVWVEEATGRKVDEIWQGYVVDIAQMGEGGGRPSMSVRDVAATLWAGIENYRRLERLPGPEYTIDDGYDLVDDLGLDQAYGAALGLIQLSAPFRKRTDELDEMARAAGEPSPVDPLRAAAAAAANGTGGSGSPSSTSPVSTLPPPGP